MSEITKKAARYTANALPLYRVYRANKTAELLDDIDSFKNPSKRTWKFARRVLLDASTDVIDGILADYAGPTRLGGYLDQLGDKFWYLRIVKQLVNNGELPEETFKVPLIRDIGMTAVRPIAEHFNLSADAQQSGKTKMHLQVAAVVASCSPLAYEQPDFVRSLHELAMGASVVSAIETVYSYAHDIREQYSNEPAVSFVLDAALAGIGQQTA